jgi:hypothetical protein
MTMMRTVLFYAALAVMSFHHGPHNHVEIPHPPAKVRRVRVSLAS